MTPSEIDALEKAAKDWIIEQANPDSTVFAVQFDAAIILELIDELRELEGLRMHRHLLISKLTSHIIDLMSERDVYRNALEVSATNYDEGGSWSGTIHQQMAIEALEAGRKLRTDDP